MPKTPTGRAIVGKIPDPGQIRGSEGNIILQLPDGRVVDFGDYNEAQVTDWLEQQGGEAGFPEGAPVTPLTSGERKGAAAIPRYGIPAAVALGTQNPILVGMADAAGEYAAQTIERKPYEEDMDAHEFARMEMEKLGISGLSGAFGFGGQKYLAPALTKGFNWGSLQTSKLYRKHLMPDKMSPSMETTMRVLRALSGEGDDMLAPSFGHLTAREGKMIAQIEQVSRSSLFSGRRWAKFTGKNLDAVSGEVEKLFRAGAEEMDDEAFAYMLRRFITDPNTGEKPFSNLVQDALYDEARRIGREFGIGGDFGGLYDFMMANANVDEVRKIVRTLRGNQLVERSGLQLPSATLLESATDAERAAFREAWQQIPADVMIEIRREVNSIANATRNSADKRYIINNFLDRRIRPIMDEAFGASDDALQMLKAADDLKGVAAARFESAGMKGALKSLADHPTYVRSYFTEGGVRRLDRLNDLEKMFKETYVEGIGPVQRVAKDLFETRILPPLRFAVLADAIDQDTGLFVGEKLLAALGRKGYGKDGGAFLRKLFGSDEIVDTLRDFATALKTVEQGEVGTKVWLQLAQGGAILQAIGGVTGVVGLGGGEAFDSNVMRRVGTAGIVLFITPNLLARKLTDPKFLRMIMDGVAHGPETRPFARMLVALGTNMADDAAQRASMTPIDQSFYSTTKGKGLLGQPQQESEWRPGP
jgi:hypothetical protein